MADLQSGVSYGSFTTSLDRIGALHSVSLNAQLLSDLNQAVGGSFSVGLHVDSATADPASGDSNDGVRFSLSDDTRVHQLRLAIE